VSAYIADSPEHTFRSPQLAGAQTKTHCAAYGAPMYYRDFTNAAPMVQREIDLAQTKATCDALAVYVWWMPRPPASSAHAYPHVASKFKAGEPTVPPTVHTR
jgi:hypothetical protein